MPTCELVGLKKKADLAASAVKWFSGLTVADATDSPAPLGACKFSQAWLLSKYTYRLLLRCRKGKKKTITQQGKRGIDLRRHCMLMKRRIGFVIIVLTITGLAYSRQ